MDTTKKIIMIIIVSIVLIRTNQKIFKWILKKQNKIAFAAKSSLISVPRPAIFVAIVTDLNFPAFDIISASSSICLAFRTL